MAHRRRFFLTVLLTLLAASASWAEAILNEKIVFDGTRYYRQASQGTDSTIVMFPANSGALEIENEDTANALLVRVIRSSESLTTINENDPHVTAGELTAPPDATWSQVQPIPGGSTTAERTITFDVRKAVGVIIDRAAGTGAVTLRLID